MVIFYSLFSSLMVIETLQNHIIFILFVISLFDEILPLKNKAYALTSKLELP
jgi:hypothetical protein